MFARLVDAHVAMLSPETIDLEHIKNGAIVSVCAFAVLGIVDVLVARRFKRSYFALHVFANVVISALCVGPALRALINPAASTVPAPGQAANAVFMCWVYALHIYHPIFFKTGTMDWVHHVPVYVLNSMMFSVRCGDSILLECLILCGLPGGVDYLLQVLEGEGTLSRAAYKHYCANINQWVRAPLGCVSGYAILLGLYHQYHEATHWEAAVALLMGVHALWNCHFFGRQAVEANVVDVVNRFASSLEAVSVLESAILARPGSPCRPPQETSPPRMLLYGAKAGNLKLPKVRALSGKQNRAAAAGKGSGAEARTPADAYPVGAGEDASPASKKAA